MDDRRLPQPFRGAAGADPFLARFSMKLRVSTLLTMVAFAFAGILSSAQSFAQNAYITNTGSNTVSVINTATNTVTATIPVGNGPLGVTVAADSSKVYIANSNTDT